MLDLGNITARKTAVALSALTALVLLIGYVGVQMLEGNWQPSSLDPLPSTATATIPTTQQPLVLKPTVPDGAITTGWEMPLDDEPLDTASREREIR